MKDKKDFQYKIFKSEACGHTVEYKMVKKEHELEKAKIDEGLSPREKIKAREQRSSKEREPRELSPEQYETGKKIARTKAVGEKERKQTLKDVLHTHKQNMPKSPSKEDLEYPMAASEEDCKCEDKTEKCECEDKEMKKREKFYIQKIQELRKAAPQYFKTKQQAEAEAAAQKQAEAEQAASEQQKIDATLARRARINSQTPEGKRVPYPIAADLYSRSQASRDAQARRNPAEATNNVSNLLGNKPASAQPAPAAKEQLYTPMNANMSMPRQDANPAANMSMPGQPPAGTDNASATAEQAPAQKYDMKNPYKVENAKNFKDAFNQARKATGGGGNVFEYGGKKYHTYTQDEFKNPEKSGVPTDNKFYKDWQAKKDVTGPGAYYANKMNPAVAATGQASTAQPAAAPAAKTPNPNTGVTGMNPDGSISSTESDGRKTLTMPQNPIPTARPDQMGILDRKYAQPGEVAAKIPSQSAMFPNGPTKNGDTATTTFPTSEKMEGNLDTHKMEGMTGKRLNYNQA